MEKNTILKKEQRMKAIEEQIKKEKRKLNEKLGKSVIAAIGIGYDKLDNSKITEICDILKSHHSPKGENNE